jgi:ribosome-binding factor A
MMTFKRADRVADLIRAEVADLLLKEVKDPRIGPVTITGAEITDDLKVAKIFFVEMGKDTCTAETQAGLQSATGFLKRKLGQRLKLRYVPDITFIVDQSFAYGSHIDQLIAEIHQAEEENNVSKDH